MEHEKKFVEVEKLPVLREHMTKVLYWPSLRALIRVLLKEAGVFRGTWILLRTCFWDMAFNKPAWHPEYFTFNDQAHEKVFKETFDEILFLIIIFNHLKNLYGEFLADEMIAKIAIPYAVAYIGKTVKPGTRITSIEQVRRILRDFLGKGERFEWTEEVSEDQTEVRYHFTQCAYVMILKAYGLKTYAAYNCLADHVVIDNTLEGVIFSRNHRLGNNDSFCDHTFRLAKQGEQKTADDYADCYKVQYGAGRFAMDHWREVLKKKCQNFATQPKLHH